ncbi:MAG: L-aspartate oxidase [Clostridia bacterium]|nr:L-aspartate oxidase [Clostridia bacterium]
MKRYDVVIVGAGVAGLNCALHLGQDRNILLICKGIPEKSDSYLAQGGICCMQGIEDYDDYFEDTMRAGHYENNPVTVDCMVRSSPEIIAELVSLGVDFAHGRDGRLAVTREGGHSRKRICFHEDSTGNEITTRLMDKVKTLPNVRIRPETTMLDIIEKDGRCLGIVAMDNATGDIEHIYADYTVLATGGIGGVYESSTNYRLLTGDSLAIAMRHGIPVDHINYVQIHPTTLYTPDKTGRRLLISESVRGEGAKLLDKNYHRFTDELQPRDVVTSAIYRQMEKDGTQYVWLDMRPVGRHELLEHFPSIVEECSDAGYDVLCECVPVVPAQHYFMGGVRSDTEGRTTMPRLYAVGETCCNGVHGANRLASNSLLEALLFAKRAALDIEAGYTKAADEDIQAAEAAINPADYSNPKDLLEDYKAMVIEAIQEANACRT